MATVLPGLETVAIHEIRCKLTEMKLKNIERGKIFFESYLPVEKLLVLRTIDNLYCFINRFSVGIHKADLLHIENKISKLDLSFIKDFKGAYVVNASRSGKHTYSRFQAAEAAMRGIARSYPKWIQGNPEYHSIEFRLDLQGEDASFYLRITESTFRFRGNNRMFSLASLRPTIAHGLIWLSVPEQQDIFIDPCCGSGTILSERGFYPFFTINGGDISEEAVRVAQYNLRSQPTVGITQWNA